MVAGHLREKKGYFYAVLNYTDAHGNRKTKWIATGLAVKGNKKRAEAFLQEQRRSFQEDVPITGDVLFADFMEQWLTVIKSSVAVTTFASYSNMVKKVIVPYFRERQIALQELSAKHIQDFYLKELERVSASSVMLLLPLTFMGVTGCKITVSLPVAFGMEPLTVIWKAIRRSSGWCLQWTMTIWPVTRMGNCEIGGSLQRQNG